ncbi:MAG: class I SAM-dependent methyltransferase, partial [Acidimicrobiales bacterium]
VADHAGAAYLRYSFTKGTAQEVRFLVEAVGLHPGMRVLDVGCGPGRHARALRAEGIEVVGLDLALTFLRTAGPGSWVRADARTVPFPNCAFDAVICLCQGGFGLLGGRGETAALAEMARVLRPGGRLALSAFSSYFAVRYLEEGDRFDADTGVNHEQASVRSPGGAEQDFDLHTTCFTPTELRLMAAGAGLAVDHLWSVAPGRYARRAPDLDHPEWLMVATRCDRAPV